MLVPLLGPWRNQCVALPAKLKKRRGNLGRDTGGVTPVAAGKSKWVGWEGLERRELHSAVQHWEGLCSWKQFPLGLCQLLPRQAHALQARSFLPMLCFASHDHGGRTLHIPSK